MAGRCGGASEDEGGKKRTSAAEGSTYFQRSGMKSDVFPRIRLDPLLYAPPKSCHG